MKYIFDFDDVLFYTTKKFIEHEYIVLDKVGISRDSIKDYYSKIKSKKTIFSMKRMLKHFYVPQKFYEEIMKENKNFVNEDLVNLIKKLGKANCYLITYGDKAFQTDKIRTSGVEPFFSEIIIVDGSKKEAIEKMCAKYKDEKIIFIDDKIEYFADIDLNKCPNLKTVLYTGQDLTSLLLP